MFRYTLTWGDESFVTTNDPKGWEDSAMSITRSPKYHGFNYAQVVNLAFTCGTGKEFIDNIYNTYGVDEEIGIKIEYACNVNNIITNNSYNSDYSSDYEKGALITDADYNTLFEGVLDLKAINIQESETSVPLIEQGKNQKFLSRLDTKVDLFQTETVEGLEFTNITEPYVIDLHSKALTSTANLIAQEYTDFGPVFGLGVNYYLIIADSDDSQFLFKNSFETADGEFFENNTPNEINARIQLFSFSGPDFTLTIPGSWPVVDYDYNVKFGIRVGNNLSPFTEIFDEQIVSFTPSSPITVSFNVNQTVIVPVQAGEKIYLSITLELVSTPGGSGDPFFTINGNFSAFELNGQAQQTTEPSTAKAQVIHEALSKVGQVILDSEIPVDSMYYGRVNSTPVSYDENGCGSFMSLTSGYMIRQYPDSFGISMSMNEMLDSLNAVDGIGVGFIQKDNDWRMSIEPMSFFYQDKRIILLENVPNIKRSFAEDRAFNKVTIGFDKWQTTAVNGLDEYCSKTEYTLGLRSITNNLELISPFLGSAYILEETRRKPYDDSSSTDTDYDNNIFMIALNRELNYDGSPALLDKAEKDENFTEINNILSPETSYNLRYMNAKNFLRILPIVSPVIAKYPQRSIIFTYGEGNKFAEVQDTIDCPSYYNGELLSANQNVIWDESGELPVIIPEHIEFDYPLSSEQFLFIKDCLFNKDNELHNGYIELSNETETFKGFIVELKYKQINGLTSFKLVRKYD